MAIHYAYVHTYMHVYVPFWYTSEWNVEMLDMPQLVSRNSGLLPNSAH